MATSKVDDILCYISTASRTHNPFLQFYVLIREIFEGVI